jgi:tight adherence protein C
MDTLLSASVFLMTFLAFTGLAARSEHAAAGGRVGQIVSRLGSHTPTGEQHQPLAQIVWKQIADPLIQRISRWGHLGISDDLAQRLMWAGLGSQPERFGAMRLMAAGAGAILLALLAGAFSRSASAAFPTALLGALGGWMAPDMWLNARVRARHAQIQRELPVFLDLIGTALESGASFTVAVEHVQREMPGILPAEFGRVLAMTGAGGGLAAGLQRLAERLGDRDVQAVADTIARSHEYGVQLVQNLTEINRTLRYERAAKAEERAGRAGVMVIVPLVVFVLPTTMLIIGYPAMVSLLHGLFQ